MSHISFQNGVWLRPCGGLRYISGGSGGLKVLCGWWEDGHGCCVGALSFWWLGVYWLMNMTGPERSFMMRINSEANLIGASCGVPIEDFHMGRCFI